MIANRHRAATAAFALLVGGCAPQTQVIGPPFVTPSVADGAVHMADGARLPLRVWMPERKLRAVIVGLHGMNDYGNAFAIPAEAWRKAGIATYAYDQRGFGATAQRGVWPGTATLTGDFAAVVRLVRERHPGVPVYAAGMSMGGGVVLAAMAREDRPALDGIILAAPAVWSRAAMPFYYTTSLWLAAHAVPQWRLTGEGLKRVPSDNMAMLRALSRDPLVIKGARADALYGVVDLMDAAYAAAPSVPVPVLLLYGEKDQIIPRRPIEDVAGRLPERLKRYAIYADGYHMVLRDLRADVVHRDVIAWVGDRNGALPSGADSAGQRALLGRAQGQNGQ
jgi:alpha-beta hydrolase superfamily lysophospholipase